MCVRKKFLLRRKKESSESEVEDNGKQNKKNRAKK